MKKLISIILALALCCMLLPAGAEEESLVGVWYICHATVNGEPVTVVDPEAVTVTLLEDGTGILSAAAFGAEKDCTWKFEDSKLILSAEGQADIEIPLVDGELKLSEETAEFFLSRTPEEPAEPFPGALTAESAADFDGTWVPSKVIAAGLLLDAETAMQGGSVATLQMEGGVCTAVVEGTDPQVTELTFDNGVLTSVEDYGIMKSTSTLTLLDDGSLLYSTTVESAEMNYTQAFIFVREAAE